VDPEIQKAAELLLGRRLRAYRAALEARRENEQPEAASTFERSAQIASFSELLRSHCLRALSDYLTRLELFDALESDNGYRSLFDGFVEEASAELVRTLGASGQAARNRVANQTVAIKAEAGIEIEAEVERAAVAKRSVERESDPGSAEELDDRLPLARRGAFDRDLARAIDEARRTATTTALVMIDIDHFKSVNDEHGHPAGDGVLLDVARLVVARAAHKGKAYRYGGEEFALLLPSYSTEEAVGMAERIRKDIEGAIVSEKKLSVTASLGVACFPDGASDAGTLLARADAALYEAKRTGRNRVRSFVDLA
jgi:diguanylate cyclase (GGDEF)-like protein